MRSVEEALAALEAALGDRRPAAEELPLAEALGRRLLAPVRMDHDLPPFDRVAMDGYALAEAAAPGRRLRVLGVVHAGEAGPAARLEPGTALRVMTGAPAPLGTRCVVPFEWTRAAGGEVEILRADPAATHVVPRGTHRREGELVLAPASRLSPSGLAALATAGVARVPVARRARVAVLGTGSELVGPGERPGPAAIRNSNNSLLLGLARAAGAECSDLGFVADEPEALACALARGLDSDLLLISGGVSLGDRDLVPAALLGAGVRCLFHRWQVQPGGPLWAGQGPHGLVLGLPGNPAAVLVGFEVLAVPLLAALEGAPFARRAVLWARYVGPATPAATRRRFRPVALDADPQQGLVARALPWQGSGDPLAFVGADGLAVLPEGCAVPSEGAVLGVIPLTGVR